MWVKGREIVKKRVVSSREKEGSVRERESGGDGGKKEREAVASLPAMH